MLNKMASLLFSLLATSVLIVPATSLPSPPVFWKLALHWPNSFCHSSGVHCIPSVPQDAFVIRTLFGASEIGQEMGCSGQQPPLDRSVIDQIGPTLAQYWPDLQGDNFGLWEKEWQQRAACYGISASDYFTNAIQLKINFDLKIARALHISNPTGDQIFAAFASKDVRPGKSYPAMTFSDILYPLLFGQRLEVLCNQDAMDSNIFQLLEINICALPGYRFLLIPCPNLVTTGCWWVVRYT